MLYNCNENSITHYVIARNTKSVALKIKQAKKTNIT